MRLSRHSTYSGPNLPYIPEFLPFLSFPSPVRSRASYGGNPVFGRFLTPWIPVPRLREDKLHGNDTDRVSPNLTKFGVRTVENRPALAGLIFLSPASISLILARTAWLDF